jgi:hypothetical protein
VLWLGARERYGSSEWRLGSAARLGASELFAGASEHAASPYVIDETDAAAKGRG